MRLLQASTREIKEFIVHENIPPYAILSHTWGEEEISLQEWQQIPLPTLKLRNGYRKIQYCCRQALGDGIEWVWIDTCCIDKTSSTELSESINSMFRWYRDARICYAYLSDVVGGTPETSNLGICRSRWFTRGWTLQELIAPYHLYFYSKDWRFLGNKFEISRLLYSITYIEPKFLDSRNLHLASIAKKMSWASKRNTSRLEDIAYSLLGIFDINMPLIYGEGKKAFRRLQEEIIKTRFDDPSIFAWGTVVTNSSIDIKGNQSVIWGAKGIPWSETKPLLGLLAESPRDFEFSSNFVPSPLAEEFYRHPDWAAPSLPVLAGPEIRIQLPVAYEFASSYQWEQLDISQIREGVTVVLLCCDEKHPNGLLLIPMQSQGRMSYGRTRELIIDNVISKVRYGRIKGIFRDTKLLHIAPEKRRVLSCGDVIIQRHTYARSNNFISITLGDGITYFENERVVVANGQLHSEFIAFDYKSEAIGGNFGFRLCLSRLKRIGTIWGPFSVGLLPIFFSESNGNLAKEINYKRFRWYDSRSSHRPTFSKEMEIPHDIWTFDYEPFPPICIWTQRKRLSGNLFVDVVNIVIKDGLEDLATSVSDITLQQQLITRAWQNPWY